MEKRIVVRREKLKYYPTYSIVGQVKGRWRWKDIRYFGTFRAAMDWIHGKKSEEE